ncbi:MAG: hypothetical protein GY700_11010, partial [Propionibacteriaceae bacterium]|nr:hypothetical protein [Propionibacteriaceae bacterium]
MNTRERFHAVMNFQPVDRLPIVEWANYWDKTVDRWHAEGLPADATTPRQIREHFGLDVYEQAWIQSRGPECPGADHHGAGILSNMDDYERIRPHLFPWPCLNYDWWHARAAEQARGDIALWFTLDGFFWFPRALFGIEKHLFAFYDEPELMHRMNNDLVEWQLKVIDEIATICTPDFMTFAEDMSYNHGPMLSRKLFDEFMTPYYQRVTPRLKELGTRIIVDSDGDVTDAAGWFQNAGCEGILPL